MFETILSNGRIVIYLTFLLDIEVISLLKWHREYFHVVISFSEIAQNEMAGTEGTCNFKAFNKYCLFVRQQGLPV